MLVKDLIRHLQFIEATTPDLRVHVLNNFHAMPEATQVQVVHQKNFPNGKKPTDIMFVRIDAT